MASSRTVPESCACAHGAATKSSQTKSPPSAASSFGALRLGSYSKNRARLDSYDPFSVKACA
jgi:hypothetical protein